ncbi:MAG: hypothetical protein RLZZ265_1212 [Verrucomicrobiota bacterium]
MAALKKVPGERGLYRNPSCGTYFVRIFHQGGDTYRSLDTARISEARQRMDARRAAKAAARLGLALEPDSAARAAGIRDVLQRYQDDGYPDKRGRPKALCRMERDNCAKLKEFFEEGWLVDHLSPKVMDDYHTWRLENVTRGEGHRTTDLELNTLNNALRWAVRKELISHNPIATRSRYHSARDARHCRECAPVDASELHTAAQLLFSNPRSEVLGWQLLFEANIGLRSGEALSLCMDARADEPGGLTKDGQSLCVRRSKDPRRNNPYVFVHSEFKQLLAAHRRWHEQRYPESPFCFPGRDRDRAQPVAVGALTQALARLRKRGQLKRKLISHGMRAFYVLVRRSNGASDSQIAWEINHVGGVHTLESVYGGVPPHWIQGKGPKLSWLPSGAPAWSCFPWESASLRAGKKQATIRRRSS